MKRLSKLEIAKQEYIKELDYMYPDSSKIKKLQEVETLLGRVSMNRNERWMFDNYWDNSEYEFRKDDRGKLWVHKI